MKYWINKKYGKQKWSSRYDKDQAGERIFVLFYHHPKKGGVRHITFESWQAAKALGWKRSK